MDYPKILELLAALEHEQWIEWSRSLTAKEHLSTKRLARWEHLWKPYDSLTEKEKESDRKYARKVLELLMGTGVLPIKKGYKISIGELFDLLAISNIKIWHLEERISKLSKSTKDKDKIEMGELTRLIRAANRERVSMKEELNLRLEGKTRALGKVEHTKLGR